MTAGTCAIACMELCFETRLKWHRSIAPITEWRGSCWLEQENLEGEMCMRINQQERLDKLASVGGGSGVKP